MFGYNNNFLICIQNVHFMRYMHLMCDYFIMNFAINLPLTKIMDF